MGITHSTPADGTFSGDGSTAWNAEHTLTESGGQALTVGAITDGQFLKRSGTTITSGTPSGNTAILAADAPNSDFDLTNGGAGGAVTILSKSITGIAAGDQIAVELQFTILNNSGATRIYSTSHALGALAVSITESAGVAANATSRSVRFHNARFSVSAANLAYGLSHPMNSAGIAVDSAGTINNSAGSGWDTTTNDLTGTQTYTFSVTSAAVTATQTLTLHSWCIRKIASNP